MDVLYGIIAFVVLAILINGWIIRYSRSLVKEMRIDVMYKEDIAFDGDEFSKRTVKNFYSDTVELMNEMVGSLYRSVCHDTICRMNNTKDIIEIIIHEYDNDYDIIQKIHYYKIALTNVSPMWRFSILQTYGIAHVVETLPEIKDKQYRMADRQYLKLETSLFASVESSLTGSAIHKKFLSQLES